MKPIKKLGNVQSEHIPMLTVQQIDEYECFKDWPEEKKEKLIRFVYELSLALYHSYCNANEKQS
jgi:hypothetical protein